MRFGKFIADAIADNFVIGRGRAADKNAVRTVARNDIVFKITGSVIGAANDIIGRVFNQDAREIGQARRGIPTHANKIPGDGIAAAGRIANPNTAPVIHVSMAGNHIASAIAPIRRSARTANHIARRAGLDENAVPIVAVVATAQQRADTICLNGVAVRVNHNPVEGEIINHQPFDDASARPCVENQAIAQSGRAVYANDGRGSGNPIRFRGPIHRHGPRNHG
ncbi:MAG: hypothetical protein HDKAJFGB_01877 [Anaerolineae bacterium]|nr:hypothetical protein [Anaerolineae bacterium]